MEDSNDKLGYKDMPKDKDLKSTGKPKLDQDAGPEVKKKDGAQYPKGKEDMAEA